MLYEFLVFIFCFVTILLILIVLMQKSHGGFWSGPASSDSTIIFGGSGGQDILQKITWVLGIIFIFLGFFLSIYKIKAARISKFTINKKIEKIEKPDNNKIILNPKDQEKNNNIKEEKTDIKSV